MKSLKLPPNEVYSTMSLITNISKIADNVRDTKRDPITIQYKPLGTQSKATEQEKKYP